MSDEVSFSLEIIFPDQSPSFAYGFEAGEVCALMKQGEPVIDRGVDGGFPVREENSVLYDALAASKGYVVERGEVQDGWVATRFTKDEQATKRPHLTIVK